MFLLAGYLKKSVAEIEELSSVEFDYWKLRFLQRPFGDQWDDWRIAALSARVVQMLVPDKQKIENHLAWNPEEYVEPKDRRKQDWAIIREAALRAQALEKNNGR